MNPRPPRQNTAAELEAFDKACERLAGFDPGISFEWVDGFLAALAAGPRLPAPEDWLPALCGDTFDRAYADPEDHARGLQALQARLKVLCDELDPEALLDAPDWLRLEPLMAEVTDEDRRLMVEQEGVPEAQAAAFQTGALWAEGFFEGVDAFPDLWTEPAAEEAAKLFENAFDQIGALLLPPDSDDWKTHLARHYPKGAPTRDDLVTEACMAVQDLRLFWIDFAPKPETRRVEPTPGRNDPCPCGSGKKYKKCHGAATS
jgi:uncharacterized protein